MKRLVSQTALAASLLIASCSSSAGAVDGKGLLCKASDAADDEQTYDLQGDSVIWFEDGRVTITTIREKDDVAKTFIGNHGDYRSTPVAIFWDFFGIEVLGVVTLNRKTLQAKYKEAIIYDECSVLNSLEEHEAAIRKSLDAQQTKINLKMKGNKL